MVVWEKVCKSCLGFGSIQIIPTNAGNHRAQSPRNGGWRNSLVYDLLCINKLLLYLHNLTLFLDLTYR